MWRLLLIVAVVLAVMAWLRRPSSKSGQAAETPPESPPEAPPKAPSATPATVDPMLPCAHCGLHVPAAEAVQDEQGRAYCSAAHRAAGPAAP